MRNIIVVLGLLGGFIFLSSMDANAVKCIGYDHGRCVTAQNRAAAVKPQAVKPEGHWCRGIRSPDYYRC
jgi:hypothetical protein